MLDGSFTFLTIDQYLLLLKHVIYSYLKIMLQKTILIIFFINIYSFGQTNQPSKNGELYKNAPEWAKLMYSENPNVNSIDRLYKA